MKVRSTCNSAMKLPAPSSMQYVHALLKQIPAELFCSLAWRHRAGMRPARDQLESSTLWQSSSHHITCQCSANVYVAGRTYRLLRAQSADRTCKIARSSVTAQCKVAAAAYCHVPLHLALFWSTLDAAWLVEFVAACHQRTADWLCRWQRSILRSVPLPNSQ